MRRRMTFFILPLTILLLLMPENIFAHPGRTASDGCHYCRTNCASWGEVYGARHCHGGGTYSPPSANTYTPPTNTPIPTKRPTNTPTLRPTFTPTPTATVTFIPSPTSAPTFTNTKTPTPSSKQEFFGKKTEVENATPTPEPLTAGQTASALGVLGGIIALPAWGVYKVIKKIKKRAIKPHTS